MFSLLTFSILVTAKRRGAQHVHHRCSHSHVSRFVYHTTRLLSFFLSFSILMPNPSRIKSCQKIDPPAASSTFPRAEPFLCIPGTRLSHLQPGGVGVWGEGVFPAAAASVRRSLHCSGSEQPLFAPLRFPHPPAADLRTRSVCSGSHHLLPSSP